MIAKSTSALREPDHVAELGEDEAFHGEADGALGAGNGEDRRAPVEPGSGPAQHGGRADILKRQPPEEFPESVDALLQEAVDRLERRGAPGRAGPPREGD